MKEGNMHPCVTSREVSPQDVPGFGGVISDLKLTRFIVVLAHKQITVRLTPGVCISTHNITATRILCVRIG